MVSEKLDLENFQSEPFLIRTYKGRTPASEFVLLRRGLPSEMALQGGSLEFKIVYRAVGADFENIVSAHNDRVYIYQCVQKLFD